MITYNISIENFVNSQYDSNITFTSGDTKAYAFKFNTQQNCEILVKAKRADGIVVIGEITKPGMEYVIPNNMYAIPGQVDFEIALLNSDGGYITSKLVYAMVREGFGDEGIEEDDRYPILTQLITKTYEFAEGKGYLTEEDIVGKEDKSNKVNKIDSGSTDNQYPSAKAVYDYDHDKWQLIEVVTLEQDVQRVYCDLKGGKYKELYIRFVIPTMNPENTSGFQKGRTFVYIQGNNVVYDDGEYRYSDTGKSWILTHQLTIIGNICSCIGKVQNVYNNNQPYLIGNYEYGTTIGKPIADNYISDLNILMYPIGTRLFPEGTTYELWGIRA